MHDVQALRTVPLITGFSCCGKSRLIITSFPQTQYYPKQGTACKWKAAPAVSTPQPITEGDGLGRGDKSERKTVETGLDP